MIDFCQSWIILLLIGDHLSKFFPLGFHSRQVPSVEGQFSHVVMTIRPLIIAKSTLQTFVRLGRYVLVCFVFGGSPHNKVQTDPPVCRLIWGSRVVRIKEVFSILIGAVEILLLNSLGKGINILRVGYSFLLIILLCW